MKPTIHRRQLDGEVDELLLRLRGLVLVRDLLERRGAGAAEIDSHTAEIERTRDRLAALVRAAGVAHSAAA